MPKYKKMKIYYPNGIINHVDFFLNHVHRIIFFYILHLYNFACLKKYIFQPCRKSVSSYSNFAPVSSYHRVDIQSQTIECPLCRKARIPRWLPQHPLHPTRRSQFVFCPPPEGQSTTGSTAHLSASCIFCWKDEKKKMVITVWTFTKQVQNIAKYSKSACSKTEHVMRSAKYFGHSDVSVLVDDDLLPIGIITLTQAGLKMSGV